MDSDMLLDAPTLLQQKIQSPESTTPNSAHVAHLISQARGKLSGQSPLGALDDLVQALRLLGGEWMVLATLQKAREAYWSGKEADGLAQMMLNCTLGHSGPAKQPDFDAIIKHLGLNQSILAETGNEGMAIGASLDGSSSVCQQCGGLVSGKRMQMHQELWCPSNNSSGMM